MHVGPAKTILTELAELMIFVIPACQSLKFCFDLRFVLILYIIYSYGFIGFNLCLCEKSFVQDISSLPDDYCKEHYRTNTTMVKWCEYVQFLIPKVFRFMPCYDNNGQLHFPAVQAAHDVISNIRHALGPIGFIADFLG